ncbi:endonuclease/exonuclease/phosphatase family protein [Naumannella halotolerans]|uniref:Vancomycin resistance protein VanJ n=1 Tax=Naumannella halotolerans TaxID=993414 RepID=A0A4R7J5U2_9ACTN|nr:endonuclease/exonuclease/phosphatase family protein [Naumannella halotolerans]TDT32731.1 vancomycin resistance protein VanJ [Naumannella halotolerans]
MSSPSSRRRGGTVVLLLGLALAALLLGHEFLPEEAGIALAVESALPWVWVLIAILLLVALVRRSVLSVIGFVVPALVWGLMFGPSLRPQAGGEPDLLVATQNVGARLPQPTATAEELIATGADLIAVQEIDSLSGEIIVERLDQEYAYSSTVGTVGLWSDLPFEVDRDAGLESPNSRSLVADVQTDLGPVRVHVVHLPSVRPGAEERRNTALSELADDIESEDAERVIVVGDLNTATTDRRFDLLSDQLTDTRVAVGGGFGFTWPAIFPLTRPDHVLVKGLEPVSDQVLDRGTSDHRAVVAGLSSDEG